MCGSACAVAFYVAARQDCRHLRMAANDTTSLPLSFWRRNQCTGNIHWVVCSNNRRMMSENCFDFIDAKIKTIVTSIDINLTKV